jgi:hypothetical protein
MINLYIYNFPLLLLIFKIKSASIDGHSDLRNSVPGIGPQWHVLSDNQVTAWCKSLHHKIRISQLVKKFLAVSE